jgi:AcrR family transcriptional regulator
VKAAVPTSRAAAAGRTRAALINAAIKRFAAAGAITSFDAVAADVGVTKGALYHHFGSKDGLIEAVYVEVVNQHARRVIAASATGDGATRVLALIDSSARLYTSRTPFYRLLIALHHDAATTRPSLAPIARRVQHAQREYMIGLVRTGQADGSIRQGVDAEALGLTINASLMGFLVQQLEPVAAQRHWIERFRHLIQETIQ